MTIDQAWNKLLDATKFSVNIEASIWNHRRNGGTVIEYTATAFAGRNDGMAQCCSPNLEVAVNTVILKLNPPDPSGSIVSMQSEIDAIER